jgi:hypothetical protein
MTRLICASTPIQPLTLPRLNSGPKPSQPISNYLKRCACFTSPSPSRNLHAYLLKPNLIDKIR